MQARFLRRLIFLVAAATLCLACGGDARTSPLSGVSRIDRYDGSPPLGDMVWSPDGTRLAVNTQRPMRSHPQDKIFILDVATGDLRLLLESNGIRDVEDWSPRGDEIAFSASLDLQGIWVVKVDGSGEPRFVDDGFVAAWSPSGDEMAILGATRDPETDQWVPSIWILDLATGDRRLVLNQDKSDGCSGLAWSPDGTRLALVFSRTTGDTSHESDIFILNLTTGRLNRLTDGGYNLSPAWSPDGTLVAYDSFDAKGSHLMIARVGGECTVEAISHISSNPAWSPDGRQIAFALRDGIYVMDIATVLGEDFLETGPVCPQE